MTAILSVVETRKRLEISVREYLADVLPEMAERKVAEIAALRQWRGRRAGVIGRRRDKRR